MTIYLINFVGYSYFFGLCFYTLFNRYSNQKTIELENLLFFLLQFSFFAIFLIYLYLNIFNLELINNGYIFPFQLDVINNFNDYFPKLIFINILITIIYIFFKRIIRVDDYIKSAEDTNKYKFYNKVFYLVNIILILSFFLNSCSSLNSDLNLILSNLGNRYYVTKIPLISLIYTLILRYENNINFSKYLYILSIAAYILINWTGQSIAIIFTLFFLILIFPTNKKEPFKDILKNLFILLLLAILFSLKPVLANNQVKFTCVPSLNLAYTALNSGYNLAKGNIIYKTNNTGNLNNQFLNPHSYVIKLIARFDSFSIFNFIDANKLKFDTYYPLKDKFIPRILLPSKQIDDAPYRFGVKNGLIIDDHMTVIKINIFAESILNYGYFFFILVLISVVIMILLLSKYVNLNNRIRNKLIAMYPVTSIIYFENNGSMYLGEIYQDIIIVCAIVISIELFYFKILKK
jgi:hypothetical protein